MVAMIGVGGLLSCSGESPDDRFAVYLKRLERTLETPHQPVRETLTPRPPRTGLIDIEITGDSLDTLDFLALRGCALQTTIGKRNSSLGRLAPASQRLLLELEFLRLSPDCIVIQRNAGEQNLAETLERARRNKQAQLPALIFNATLGAAEYRSFWLPRHKPGDFPPVASSVASAALTDINALAARWLSGDYSADGTEFELLLADVAGGDGGVLLQRMARQADWLDIADQALKARLLRGPLCGPNLRHDAATILPQVVRTYFVEGIQPQGAAMERRYFSLVPEVQQLENLLANVLPNPYKEWATERDRRFEVARNAPAAHVAQLQGILEPCTDSGLVGSAPPV